jgi:hypothetical protein
MNRAQVIETIAKAFDPVELTVPLHRAFDLKRDRLICDAATAAMAALEAAGMVVVPREPTPAMTSASYMLYMREKSRDVAWSGKKNGHLIYDAMIKAHLFDIDGLINEGIWRWGQLFNFQEMDDEVLLEWAHDILDDFPEVEQRPTDDVLLEKIKVAAAYEWKMT